MLCIILNSRNVCAGLNILFEDLLLGKNAKVTSCVENFYLLLNLLALGLQQSKKSALLMLLPLLLNSAIFPVRFATLRSNITMQRAIYCFVYGKVDCVFSRPPILSLVDMWRIVQNGRFSLVILIFLRMQLE